MVRSNQYKTVNCEDKRLMGLCFIERERIISEIEEYGLRIKKLKNERIELSNTVLSGKLELKRSTVANYSALFSKCHS